MAGEMKDCISLQAEHLPTGSISFGRFELETLSWERRSSFSHNRYLEEVEKCSTPGSVTQKRAILEAHFKKKPLLPQSSFESQSLEECQTTENYCDHQAGSSDQFEDRNDGKQPECQSLEECQTTENHLDLQASSSDRFEDCNDGKQPGCGLYHEALGDSDEAEVMECEQHETWQSEVPAESVLYNDERDANHTEERSDNGEILQDQAGQDCMISNKDHLCAVADQELDTKAVIAEEFLEPKVTVVMEEVVENKEAILVEELKSDVSSKSHAGEKKRAASFKKKIQKSLLQGKEVVEQITARTKQTDQVPAQQGLRKSSIERTYVSSGKMLSRSTGKLERESTLKRKTVKQLPSRTLMPMSSDSRSPDLETSTSTIAKVRQGNRSAKDVRMKMGGIVPRLISVRNEVDVCRPSNRPKVVAHSAKEETEKSSAVFNFRSNERAEKRKEYNLKLEEKLQAKEAEMNEIQSRTQEETEATIKQLRRNLNFKATPMPSFYHEAVPSVADGKKAAAMPAKSQKSQNKSTSPWSRAYPREKSPSLSKAANFRSPPSDQSNLASGSVKQCDKVKKDERSKVGGTSRKKKTEVQSKAKRSSVGTAKRSSIIGGSVTVHDAS